MVILIQSHQIHKVFPSIVLKGVSDDQITGIALMLGQVIGVDQDIASIAGDTGELLLGVEGVKVLCGGVDQMSAAVIHAEGIPTVAQIVPQAVVLAL